MQTFIRIYNWICKQRKAANPVQDSGNKGLPFWCHILWARAENVLSMLADNDIDFQSTAVLIRQRFRHERCIQAVLGCNRFHNGFIMHHVVRCGQRIATCEINFILSWSVLVTGGSRVQSHFFQRQADFPSGIFALVQRCNVQIAALVIGFSSRIALYISLKQIKFTAGCNLTLIVFSSISRMVLRRFCRKSPAYGLPSMVIRLQKNRTTLPDCGRHGKTERVVHSGFSNKF